MFAGKHLKQLIMQKTKTHIEIGRAGEYIAVAYLKEKGYKILKTNVRYTWGEIDIVAKDCNNVLVFVEVKSLNQKKPISGQEGGLRPEDNLTRSKLFKLKKTCLFFANQNPKLTRKGWRIDLLALTISGKDCDINHLENII